MFYTLDITMMINEAKLWQRNCLKNALDWVTDESIYSILFTNQNIT